MDDDDVLFWPTALRDLMGGRTLTLLATRHLHTTSGNRTLDRVILQAALVLRFSSEGRSNPVWVLVDLGYRRR